MNESQKLNFEDNMNCTCSCKTQEVYVVEQSKVPFRKLNCIGQNDLVQGHDVISCEGTLK